MWMQPQLCVYLLFLANWVHCLLEAGVGYCRLLSLMEICSSAARCVSNWLEISSTCKTQLMTSQCIMVFFYISCFFILRDCHQGVKMISLKKK